MSEPLTVKVSSRNQIVVPAAARQQLNIEKGDRLLVDVQDGMLILIPVPQNYTDHLAGLHRETWDGLDVNDYLDRERSAWQESQTD